MKMAGVLPEVDASCLSESDNGANPNVRGEDGQMPLHEAAKGGSLKLELVDLLIKRGAEIKPDRDLFDLCMEFAARFPSQNPCLRWALKKLKLN